MAYRRCWESECSSCEEMENYLVKCKLPEVLKSAISEDGETFFPRGSECHYKLESPFRRDDPADNNEGECYFHGDSCDCWKSGRSHCDNR